MIGLIDEIAWAELDVDLKGYFLVGQAVAREMAKRKSGAIVNVSSASQLRPSPNLTHYGSANGGVMALSRPLAFQLAPFGIGVNPRAPGRTATASQRKALAHPAFHEGAQRAAARRPKERE